jgi:hypothetical protein
MCEDKQNILDVEHPTLSGEQLDEYAKKIGCRDRHAGESDEHYGEIINAFLFEGKHKTD